MRYAVADENEHQCGHAHMSLDSALACLLKRRRETDEVFQLYKGRLQPLSEEEVLDIYEKAQQDLSH